MSKLSWYDDCPNCGRIFSFADEECKGCGFDPVNNPEDEKIYDAHIEKKLLEDGE